MALFKCVNKLTETYVSWKRSKTLKFVIIIYSSDIDLLGSLSKQLTSNFGYLNYNILKFLQEM